MAADAAARPSVKGFYEARSGSIQYVVADPVTRRCAIIDPVLDFDEKSGSIETRQAELILDHVKRNELTVEWILDTHPHADHFSAAAYLKEMTRAPTGIGCEVVRVQNLWKRDLQLAGACNGWLAMGSSFCGRRAVFPRFARRSRDLLTGPHACFDNLCHRRCGVRARYDLHAGQRHRACRFPRRRRPAIVALHKYHSRIAG